MRRAWRCDCDGASHLAGGSYSTGHAEEGVRRHLDVIAHVTGSKPPTCPWRAFTDPLVAEVMDLAPWVDPPNLAAVVGEHTPAILVDALAAYRRALVATQAEDMRLRREEQERKAKAAAAKHSR
jgi:hypothetical protein